MIHLRPFGRWFDQDAGAAQIEPTGAAPGLIVTLTAVVVVAFGKVHQRVERADPFPRAIDERAMIGAQADAADILLNRRESLRFEIVGEQRAQLLFVLPGVTGRLDTFDRE